MAPTSPPLVPALHVNNDELLTLETQSKQMCKESFY